MSEYNCPIGGCDFTSECVKGINGHSQCHDETVQFPTKEMLCKDLNRVKSKIGRTPRMYDIEEFGKFSSSPYISAFGGWNNALEYCSLDINQKSSVTKDELLEELERVSDKIGETPTTRQMDKFGNFSSHTYSKHFGCWSDAIKEAGLKYDPYVSGEDHYAWNGGNTKFYKTESGVAWRKAVFQRDNYTCQDCGDDTGNNLNAHHIKRRKNHPELELMVWNGVTLCQYCHAERHKGEDVYEMLESKALNNDSDNSKS